MCLVTPQHRPHWRTPRYRALQAPAGATRSKQDVGALATLESEIHRIVYRLFALTPNEITLIESSLAG